MVYVFCVMWMYAINSSATTMEVMGMVLTPLHYLYIQDHNSCVYIHNPYTMYITCTLQTLHTTKTHKYTH
ncbi:hypothetical protein EON63_20275 [archaeon]|nr:MAG: hypothetical protein EON63_20275 [archaeon]